VVDDEEALRDCLRQKLIGAGHIVHEASGANALTIMEKYGDTIAVLITDVVMPGVNGVDLALAFLQKHPGTPIIFMSGYDEEIMARYPQAPKAVFLKKPFSLSHLANRVAALLTKDTRTTEAILDLDTNVFPRVQNISCDRDSDLPARYFLDELDDPSREEYEEHFFGCRICARRVREFFVMMTVVREALFGTAE
jgi:FixJ family two-component response regulator